MSDTLRDPLNVEIDELRIQVKSLGDALDHCFRIGLKSEARAKQLEQGLKAIRTAIDTLLNE